MAVLNWTPIISVSVVPVVIISSCGLLCLAFYNRLAAIVSRLCAFQRERLAEQDRLRSAQTDDPSVARRQRLLESLEDQTSRVLRRARLIRLTLMFLLLTISLLIVCCLALGLSVLVPAVGPVAPVLFATGLLSMLMSTLLAMLELKAALQPAELKSRAVADLLHSPRSDDHEDVV